MLFHKKARKHRWDVEKYNRIKQVNNQRQILQTMLSFFLFSRVLTRSSLTSRRFVTLFRSTSLQPRRETRAWELEEDSLGSTISETSSASFNEESNTSFRSDPPHKSDTKLFTIVQILMNISSVNLSILF